MADTALLQPAAPAAAGDGAPLRLRILSAHARQLHDHLARLDERDRRARLGRPVATAAVEAYCTRSRVADPLILGGFVDGDLVASAELFAPVDESFAAGGAVPVADLLLAIERPHRGRGLGLRLMNEAIRHGASRRIALVRMEFDRGNLPMERLTARLGAVHHRLGQ
jgi:GNAT superfamily N-acetyltransferase